MPIIILQKIVLDARYLNRCEILPEKYNTEIFFERQHKLGTIAFISNLKGLQKGNLYILSEKKKSNRSND